MSIGRSDSVGWKFILGNRVSFFWGLIEFGVWGKNLIFWVIWGYMIPLVWVLIYHKWPDFGDYYRFFDYIWDVWEY